MTLILLNTRTCHQVNSDSDTSYSVGRRWVVCIIDENDKLACYLSTTNL